MVAGGPQVEAFEKEFANFLGIKRVVGVGSGTDALRIALLALLRLAEKVRPEEIKGTLIVAFVAQQWTGGRGMNRLLTEIHPDEMIFVGHVVSRPPANEKGVISSSRPSEKRLRRSPCCKNRCTSDTSTTYWLPIF